jgi:photosystem II stability/assembly factor-like uncharacterized protein
VTPQNLYVATDVAAFKSIDGAATWTLISSGLVDISMSGPFIVDASSHETVYSGGGLVFKSIDGGASWVILGTTQYPPGGEPINVVAIGLDPQFPTTVYAGTSSPVSLGDGPHGDGVYRSGDGGANWASLHGGMPAGTPVSSLAIVRESGLVYAGTWYGVFQTHRGGASWRPLNSGLTNIHIGPLAFDEASDTLYAGTSDGLFKLRGASEAKPGRAPQVVPFRGR